MSFGANKYNFPLEKMELFFDVFETLPDIRFIIKYDELGSLSGTLNSSSQIMLHNWWPQQAILGKNSLPYYNMDNNFLKLLNSP